MVLEAKFGQYLPLNRQSKSYAREGVELSVSTLADGVGTAAAVLSPLHALIEAHVLAAERLHGDDTTVPLLARSKTITARLWAYVRLRCMDQLASAVIRGACAVTRCGHTPVVQAQACGSAP
jgi:transposase